MSDTSQTTAEEPQTPAPPNDMASHIPWENKGRGSTLWAWFRTTWMVLSRFGRLGPLMTQEVSVRKASKFRWMTVALASMPMLVVMLFPVGAAVKDLTDGRGTAVSAVALTAACAAGLLLYIGMLGGWAGIVTWFVATRSLPGELRDRAAALGYYLTAPAGLSALSLLVLPFEFMTDLENLFRFSATVLVVGIVAPLLLWYVLAVVGSRSFGRRNAAGVLFTALVLPLAWAVFGIMLLSLPIGLLMWAIIPASMG